MCGIGGIVAKQKVSEHEITELMSSIVHRGPDDFAFHLEDNFGIGFRRLSILDVQNGRQPFNNKEAGIIAVLNGELYNYKGIREELSKKGYVFKTNSDAEVVIPCYQEFGLSFVDKLKGMFVIAIMDNSKKELVLIRDRFGIKPIYYNINKNGFVFSSEFKQIKNYSKKKISERGLSDYLRFGYLIGENSIYTDVKKLPPSTILVLNCLNLEWTMHKYWNIKDKVNYEFTESQLIEKVDYLFSNSVKEHMQSDVPIGAFLSGGVDSSLVVSRMIQHSGSRIKTFSLGFESQDFNELSSARLIANTFNTEHYEYTLYDNSTEYFDQIVNVFDEPFADSSALPTYYISKMASEHVKVILTGDGGDEIFAGYNNYFKYLKYRNLLGVCPKKLRIVLGNAYRIFPKHSDVRRLFYLMSQGHLNPIVSNGIFNSDELNGVLLNNKSIGNLRNNNSKVEIYKKHPNLEFITECQLVDIETYLTNDILHKVDMCSMAASIETRVPFLDHELVEFAFTIPTEVKIKNLIPKYILKRILENKLPSEIKK